MNFKLKSNLKPAGDQPKAISAIIKNILNGEKNQVLLGATGTGKTFTMANIIKELQMPTLIMAHNKTLAMQIFSEMKELFSSESVEICYYVSFFDYYRPESYKPNYNLYLEKRTQKNKSIEKMRMNCLNALANNKSVIVVASVASIYGCISPQAYKNSFVKIEIGSLISHDSLFFEEISRIGYSLDKKNIKVFLDKNNEIEKIEVSKEDNSVDHIKVFGGKVTSLQNSKEGRLFNKENLFFFPVQYVVEEKEKLKKIISRIRFDLNNQLSSLRNLEKEYEAKRLEKVVNSDLIDIEEFGFCSGVENYSLYFDGRKEGDCPFTLLDFFKKENFLSIIDESHITLPQVRAMYNTDRNRKQTLVDHGFRLPSALDNRPLGFKEFESKLGNAVYLSATPGDFEVEKSKNLVVEQIIRPTGLVDPLVEVRSSKNQINDMIEGIKETVKKKGRVLIYALTISMSEDISFFLQEKGIKSVFIHSKMNVFDRYQAISNLRRGVYEVIVGINLLKEGIDIPEVSMVYIIDADKAGFLRDYRSLIQIIGRASRNKDGYVVMYADNLTKDMKKSISETNRRRKIQEEHNSKHGITPMTINKKVFGNVLLEPEVLEMANKFKSLDKTKDKEKIIKKLERIIKSSVKEFNFDKAIEIRNLIIDLKSY